jgi:transcriptional regulator with XRE-family HTH domain
MCRTTNSDRADHATFGALLRRLRARVDPAADALGPYARFPRRRGRPVTQEEVAEAIGVSRVWYAMLESSATTRASPPLLDRLAIALMATPEERVLLFRLALPEIVEPACVSAESASVMETFAVIRPAAKRLWGATSETEAFTIASEQLAVWFRDAALTHCMRRVEAGRWEWSYVPGRGVGPRVLGVVREIEGPMTSGQIDDFHLYPRLVQPGTVGTPETYDPALLRVRLDAFSRRNLDVTDFLHARVHARSGAVGSMNVVHKAHHTYSEADRAVIGTLAELTSLALS